MVKIIGLLTELRSVVLCLAQAFGERIPDRIPRGIHGCGHAVLEGLRIQSLQGSQLFRNPVVVFLQEKAHLIRLAPVHELKLLYQLIVPVIQVAELLDHLCIIAYLLPEPVRVSRFCGPVCPDQLIGIIQIHDRDCVAHLQTSIIN